MRKLTVFSIIATVLTIIIINGHTQSSSTQYYKQVSVNAPLYYNSALDKAKAEVIGDIFKGASNLIEFKPNQDHQNADASNLRRDYSQALMGINNLTESSKTHIISNKDNENQPKLLSFIEVEKKSETDGNVTLNQSKLHAYFEEESSSLQNKLKQVLDKAQDFETSDPMQAVKYYQTSYPIYDTLNKIVLLKHATQSNDNLNVVRQELVQNITKASGNLQMSYREVTQKVASLQQKARPVSTTTSPVAHIARAIALQIMAQNQKPHIIQMNMFTCEETKQSSPISQSLYAALQNELPNWDFLPLTRGMQKRPVKLDGEFWRTDDNTVLVKASLNNGNTWDQLGSVNLSIPITDLNGIEVFPANFTQIKEHHSVFHKNIEFDDTKTINGNELSVDLWTDKGQETVAYVKDELMTVYCKVNQPSYVRLLYRLENNRYTLLYENIEIGKDRIDQSVEIDSFLCTPPFGSETLIIQAKKTKFQPLQTNSRGGYDYLKTEDPLKVKELLSVQGAVLTEISVTTVEKAF
ncbi:hypothetical protein JT359_03895 [Candidatus Poribacteria bacterium]|nr:hypothetical protein [Candidatus Poribacteria bacterium]